MGELWDLKGRLKTVMANANRGDRAIVGGGSTPTVTNVINYYQVSSAGDAADFGDLSSARTEIAGVSSSTRICWGAQTSDDYPSATVIDYVQFSSTGNAADFGNLTVGRKAAGSASNNSRGIWAGGYAGSNPRSDVMDYVQLVSTGNAVDFGNLIVGRSGSGGFASPTRAVFAGGGVTGGAGPGAIDYVTFATLGNAADFGDLDVAKEEMGGNSDGVIGLFAGGHPAAVDTIQQCLIATTANMTDWGDLSVGRSYPVDGSNNVRGTFASGSDPGMSNVIDYITFASSGDAVDFGDLTDGVGDGAGGHSSGHGGILIELQGLRPELGGHPDRAAFGGGFNSGDPAESDVIDYVQIMSTGNAADFGNLSVARGQTTGCSSGTRGITYAGDESSSPHVESNVIDYITLASVGNATDFGDADVARRFLGAGSNDIRGFGGGGYEPARSEVIDYITIASTGNATDFGNLLTVTSLPSNFLASSVRGVVAGGQHTGPSGGVTNDVMQYITIASTGDATDFGDTTSAQYAAGGANNKTRGVFIGGGSPIRKTIDYITIASTGDAADFGDLPGNRRYAGATSNLTRAILGAGTAPAHVTTVEYLYPATLGNGVDFGDLTEARAAPSAMCGSHGGIHA